MPKNRSIFEQLGVVDSSIFGSKTLNPKKAGQLAKAIGEGAKAVSSINEARASFVLVERAEVELEKSKLELAVLRHEAIERKAVRRSVWEVISDVVVDTYESASKKSA